MDEKLKLKLLKEQIEILNAASEVLRDSWNRVSAIFSVQKDNLTIAEKESCEALTARFARLCDFLFNRAFRTVDQIELVEEGTGIDRLNRMEKRGVISSTNLWRKLRDLRNDIAHEYLIRKSDRVLHETVLHSADLLQTVDQYIKYVREKKYLD